MKTFIFFSLLTVMPLGLTNVSAADADDAGVPPIPEPTQKLHVWRDAEGVTHYSDTPPDGPTMPVTGAAKPKTPGSLMVYEPVPLRRPAPLKTLQANGPLKPRDLRVGNGPSFIPRMDARCEWLSGRITSLKKLIDDGGRGGDSIWQEEYGRRCGEWPRQCAQYAEQRPTCSGAKSAKPKQSKLRRP